MWLKPSMCLYHCIYAKSDIIFSLTCIYNYILVHQYVSVSLNQTSISPLLFSCPWTLPLSIQTHSFFYSLPVFPLFHQPFFLPHVHVFSLILSIYLRSSIFSSTPLPLQCPGTSIFTSLSPSLACLVIGPPSPLSLALSVKLFSSLSPLLSSTKSYYTRFIPDFKKTRLHVICLYIFKPQRLLIFSSNDPFKINVPVHFVFSSLSLRFKKNLTEKKRTKLLNFQ